ncbi:carbohydrate ABC transporter permease [Paenibacillus lignilyticus]|uniref:Carbohydrate ABC transporter permease n=1 Tax=Paenibacillus lignilyticus TaxID=1172615 RepID=A0ABS5CBN3_9BACL|nr:carbohydrate ABC transporter permease [Paenibacillus lignilyticus]MBP3962533.1 carbohydrate ABC transporter permease [Paenibacillus lignilyticus]
MIQPYSWSRKVFVGFNYTLLAVLSLICLLPLINVFSVSLSSAAAIEAGKVTLWPIDFTTKAYEFVARKQEFLISMGISAKRVALGVSINMLLTMLTAYPLSKEAANLKFRTGYAWFFVFTMLFSGGLIPSYMVVRNLHMLDSLWALVLPGALPVFNVILMLNFFRGLPKELSESAYIDGAGHWQTLWRIIVPLSMPSIATVTLFAIVTHWNEWFYGLIYMNDPIHYPLASYLQTIVVRMDMSSISDPSMILLLSQLNDRSVRAAQIFLGMVPVLCVYPFLQRYFMSGMTLGSVKE